MAELSGVVVTHNSADVIEECLEAAILCCGEVTVVDNASTDDTVAKARAFPGVRVIANRENLGFAGGVNVGVSHSRAATVLVMNPDVVLESQPHPLAEACEAHGYGAAAGMLTGHDGLPQRGFGIRRLPSASSLAFEVLGINRLFPANPVNRRWRALDQDLSAAADVEQPAGALFAFRREAWEALGGFDSRFHPVWFEDVDFCRRLALAGWRVRYVPEVRARHAGGASIRKMAGSDREVHWYVNLLRYSATAFGLSGRLGVAVSVAVAAVLRGGWSILHPGRWPQVPAYPQVVLGKGVKGEAGGAHWNGAATAAHSETTDTQPNVP